MKEIQSLLIIVSDGLKMIAQGFEAVSEKVDEIAKSQAAEEPKGTVIPKATGQIPNKGRARPVRPNQNPPVTPRPGIAPGKATNGSTRRVQRSAGSLFACASSARTAPSTASQSHISINGLCRRASMRGSSGSSFCAIRRCSTASAGATFSSAACQAAEISSRQRL